MRVMVIMKANDKTEAGVMPSEQMLREMGEYNEQLVNAGIMVDGEGLKPSSKGVRIAFDNNHVTVSDGPFAETKELVAGYWVWQVKSIAEAIDWAKRIPNSEQDTFEVEIRPFVEADDFGEAFTPELRAQEEALRTRLEER